MVGVTLLLLALPDNLGIGGFGHDNLGLGPFAAQNPRHACDRPASAIARDEIIQPVALEIAKDLVACCHFVDIGVVGGLELMGKEPAIRLRQLFCLAIHPDALLGPRGQHNLCTKHPHQPAPLDRKAIGHGDNKRIALLRADQCQADPGVAARGLDHGLARLDPAFPLGGFDDVKSEAVFHRTAGIEELGLHIEPNTGRREIVDPYAGRIANCIEN